MWPGEDLGQGTQLGVGDRETSQRDCSRLAAHRAHEPRSQGKPPRTTAPSPAQPPLTRLSPSTGLGETGHLGEAPAPQQREKGCRDAQPGGCRQPHVPWYPRHGLEPGPGSSRGVGTAVWVSRSAGEEMIFGKLTPKTPTPAGTGPGECSLVA